MWQRVGKNCKYGSQVYLLLSWWLSLSRFPGEHTGDVKDSALCQNGTLFREICPVQMTHMSMMLFGRWSKSTQITNDYDQSRECTALRQITDDHTLPVVTASYITQNKFLQKSDRNKRISINSLHFTRVVLLHIISIN